MLQFVFSFVPVLYLCHIDNHYSRDLNGITDLIFFITDTTFLQMDFRQECRPCSGVAGMERRPNSGPDTPIPASRHFWSTLALPLWISDLRQGQLPLPAPFWNTRHLIVYVRKRESPCTRCYTAILRVDLYVGPDFMGARVYGMVIGALALLNYTVVVTGGPLPCIASLHVVSTHYPLAPFRTHTDSCIVPHPQVKGDGSSSSHTITLYGGMLPTQHYVVRARTRLLYRHAHRRPHSLGWRWGTVLTLKTLPDYTVAYTSGVTGHMCCYLLPLHVCVTEQTENVCSTHLHASFFLV